MRSGEVKNFFVRQLTAHTQSHTKRRSPVYTYTMPLHSAPSRTSWQVSMPGVVVENIWPSSVAQLLDYYPYGATRVSSTTFPTNEKRQYIGQFSDLQTNLSYLNARYLDPQRGQFLSQDPVLLALGNKNQVKQLTQQDQQDSLMNPQQMNIYGYSRDNPITQKDPDGLFSLGISYSGNYEAGFGAFHASYVSANYNIVVNPSTWQVWGVKSVSSAVTSGYLKNYVSAYDTDHPPMVIGIYGGYGASGNFSPNLINPNDIGDTQESLNVNTPLSFSVQGTGTDNPTYGVGLGAKGIASVSRYPVNTMILSVAPMKASGFVSAVTSAYQQALNNIQMQINKIQATINQLVVSQSKK
jgi:RHS repeat-associated protein